MTNTISTGIRRKPGHPVDTPCCGRDVDLDSATVAVNFTVVRIKGAGLARKSTKSEAGERTLLLSS